jgi:hypothetical protein
MTRRQTAADAIEPVALPITSFPRDQVLGRLAWIQSAPIAELKNEWRRLYGKEPPPFSRSYITSRLAYRVQELRRWASSWMAGTSCCGGFAPTAGRCRARG